MTPQNQKGWRAELALHYTATGNRTLLSHKHVGPLRVQRPFFPEGTVNHTYLLHPPGGLVGDDVLQIDTNVAAGAHVLMTTPGATKAYRNVCDASVVQQHFKVDGILEWMPQEVILFDGSKLKSETVFNLAVDAKLIGWEIQCLGRPVADLPFRSGSARFDTQINVDGQPLLRDRLMLEGGSAMMNAPWGLDGATALGVMLGYPADESLRDTARAVVADTCVSAAVTLLDDLLVIRAMSAQAQDIRRVFIEIWQAIRPVMLERMACPPRIWAT